MLSSIIGFNGTENGRGSIRSNNLFNMYPDICLYIYLSNIPHNNTHNNRFVSYKIPISSGYQSIEFNAENINFAQYIEITDTSFILNKIDLCIYDRFGNMMSNNGFDFTLTLAIES